MLMFSLHTKKPGGYTTGLTFHGAGDGNRTRVISLEVCGCFALARLTGIMQTIYLRLIGLLSL